MRIAIVCQYYYPEIGAPSSRMRALSAGLKALGHEVVVVTGFPNHPTGVLPRQYKGKCMAREEIDGVTVLRNWIYATPNEGFFRRILNHLSFMASVIILGGPRLGSVDVLVASSPSFLAVPAAWLLSIFKRAPLIFEVRDLWPGVFVELGVLKNRFLIRALELMEMFLYRRSAAVVTVTESFKEILSARGVPREKITVITNGVDTEAFRPGEPSLRSRRDLGLEDGFIVLYLGTHGISQALQAVLKSAQDLESDKDIFFLFVGEGAEKRMLVNTAQRLGLSNVRFMAGQTRERVLDIYRLADVCLVPLRDIASFSAFIPSKMFEIMACGKPIVASIRGEAARILERSGAAIVVAPEDHAAISRAICSLKADSARRTSMGEKGRAFVEEHYSYGAISKRYEELLSLSSLRTQRR